MSRSLALGMVLVVLGWSPLAAQQPAIRPGGLQFTRAELEQMLLRYEQLAAEASAGRETREQAREEAGRIRQRLSEGDFQTGDRIALVVEGQTALTDTFNVASGQTLVLPELGQVSLRGVLRSELEPHMRAFIGRFIRDPVVRATSLVRLEITGAVVRPGFYAVAADQLVSEALMVAGGPTGTAKLDDVTIERAGEEIWSAEEMRTAIIEGRTLDQLSVRAGDGIRVGEAGNRLQTLQNVGFLVAGIASFVTLMIQIF